MEEKTKHLKFFGIGRILPFLKPLRKLIFIMIFFGLMGSATDIILPQFQRYALDHFVGLGVLDTQNRLARNCCTLLLQILEPIDVFIKYVSIP